MPKKRRYAVGGRKTHQAGRMNKSEEKYYNTILYPKFLAGDYLWVEYEPVKFNLAKRTTYTPDFMCLCKDGTIEVHEYKGFWEDDARVKWKVAAEKFWFYKWIAITGTGTKKKPYKKEVYGE